MSETLKGASIREALLLSTIQNAAHIDFYRSYWNKTNLDDVKSLNDLALIPTLSKVDYRNSLMFNSSATASTDFISHSTGTTGELTWRHRNMQEAAVIQAIFGGLRNPTTRQLVLSIRYNRHGMPMPFPGPSRVIPISLTDDTEIRQCCKMLSSTYRFKDGVFQPTVIVGQAWDIGLLAQAMAETDRCQAVNIHSVHLAANTPVGMLPSLMAAFPEAMCTETFSLSEIFGGATRTITDPVFRLDAFVIGEVVNEDGMPLPVGGVGELALTELYPFVQQQPLSRYRTGDVVRRLPDVKDNDPNLAFDWLGRRTQCLAGRDHWVMTYRPIADWLGKWM